MKIMRGDEGSWGVEGKVTEVNTKTGRIIIEGVTMPKADGTMKARSVHASNVMITKLDLNDPWRKEKLQREGGILMSNDMKRLTAPRSWPVPRKTNVWITSPRPGPTRSRRACPW